MFQGVREASQNQLNCMDLVNQVIIEGESSNYSALNRTIQTLSGMLLIAEPKLMAKYLGEKENFTKYVARKWEKYGFILTTAKEIYNSIIGKYNTLDAKDSSVLTLKDDQWDANICAGLTKWMLMKIVRKCVREVFEDENSGNDGVEVYIEKFRWHLLVNREGNSVRIVKWSGKQAIENNHDCFIGCGSFGTVQKVYDVTYARFSALKIELSNPLWGDSISTMSIINEVNKLKQIHGDSIYQGIQLPPDVLYKKPFTGVLQKLYVEGDLLSYYEKRGYDPNCISVKDGLTMIDDVMAGVMRLHRKDRNKQVMIHGDIKPENIFVGQDDNEGCRFYIADFGGAMIPKLEVDLNDQSGALCPPLGTVATCRFFTLGDCNALNDAMQKKKLHRWIRLQKKRDVFAAGVSLWIVLSGAVPFEMGAFGKYPITGNPKNEYIVENKYGIRINRCLLQMLSEDPNDRPSAKKVCKIVRKVLSERGI
ncbi:MAG: hypothetical protein VX777_09710 [Chlamydiota bacterium]|nr:hypothetical protein [Chlamydiota bacterium]